MAILGDNTTPGSASWFDVTGNKQYWTAAPYVMPAGGGIATDINVYCGGDGTSVTGQLMLWDNVGNIVWQSGNITLSSGSRSIGGQAWQHASIPNVYLAAGSYILGFWSSGHVVWTAESTGGVNGRSGLASPSTATGGSDEYAGGGFGRLGAYVVYTPGTFYADDGSAYQAGCIAWADDGATWQQCSIFGDDGAAWQQIG